MRDKKRPDTEPFRPDYRDRASTLHDEAERVHSPEAKQTLESVARCYEILAEHVERRRSKRPR